MLRTKLLTDKRQASKFMETVKIHKNRDTLFLYNEFSDTI